MSLDICWIHWTYLKGPLGVSPSKSYQSFRIQCCTPSVINEPITPETNRHARTCSDIDARNRSLPWPAFAFHRRCGALLVTLVQNAYGFIFAVTCSGIDPPFRSYRTYRRLRNVNNDRTEVGLTFTYRLV